ncbi:F-box protein At1g47056-like [Triticum dicoccoides]|uniref:F-box protein At1g47056-like n=1 Tax=Triticum dicoccoides TaxID=85692 RepID=UPI000E7898BC|nr:F-box protein At1g47056-like [Triticum dicoccoides]
MGQCPSAPRYHHHRKPPPTPPSPTAQAASPRFCSAAAAEDAAAEADYTSDLPEELLAVVFGLLGSGDRKRCSLVCRRWLATEASSRLRLALDARAPLLAAAPAILARFSSVSKLALKCDRRAESVGDPALALVAHRLGPGLRRLKLRSVRAVTDHGVAALAAAAINLRKLSVGSCTFGAKGIEAVLRSCPQLEELSVKRLRGLADSEPITVSSPRLQSLALKELYNGQCFSCLITCSPNLKTLKIIRCSGDWDPVLQAIPQGSLLAELHLEKLQVSDLGVAALCGLEVLYLAKAPEVTDVGLAALATKSPRLRKLHVDGWKANRIGDRGLATVAQKCAALQELVLIGVNLTSASLELIAANCPTLERLALCGSDTFGDAEISCVATKCASLRKLCIKACPVSDAGMDKLAAGCPRLVKVKVKKCRRVTFECAERLRASRHGALAVNFDTPGGAGELQDASVDESGVLENAGSDVVQDDFDDQIGVPDLLCGTSGRPSGWKARIVALISRSLSVSMFRRRPRGSSHNS